MNQESRVCACVGVYWGAQSERAPTQPRSRIQRATKRAIKSNETNYTTCTLRVLRYAIRSDGVRMCAVTRPTRLLVRRRLLELVQQQLHQLLMAVTDGVLVRRQPGSIDPFDRYGRVAVRNVGVWIDLGEVQQRHGVLEARCVALGG